MVHMWNFMPRVSLGVALLPVAYADTGANWDSGPGDFFEFPESRETLQATRRNFADMDLIEVQWVQTTNRSYFEFVCCEPEDDGNCGSE